MNYIWLIVGGIAVLGLIIFIVRKNIKDKIELEEKIKKDYPKPRDQEGDVEIEDEKI